MTSLPLVRSLVVALPLALLACGSFEGSVSDGDGGTTSGGTTSGGTTSGGTTSGGTPDNGGACASANDEAPATLQVAQGRCDALRTNPTATLVGASYCVGATRRYRCIFQSENRVPTDGADSECRKTSLRTGGVGVVAALTESPYRAVARLSTAVGGETRMARQLAAFVELSQTGAVQPLQGGKDRIVVCAFELP
jgi:hypothetical protein